MTETFEERKSVCTQEQADVSMSMGGRLWQGFEYTQNGLPALEIYATSGDKYIRISAMGYQFFGTETWLILSAFAEN